MSRINDIPATYDDAVRTLARWHGEDADDPVTIYAIPDPNARSVRLLEVSDAHPRADRMDVFSIGASDEFPFPSSVALVNPADWQRALKGELPMPAEWRLAQRIQVWPNG